MKGLGSTVIVKGAGRANRAQQNVPVWLSGHQPQVQAVRVVGLAPLRPSGCRAVAPCPTGRLGGSGGDRHRPARGTGS